MPKKKPVGRPKKTGKRTKLTLYVRPATCQAIRKALLEMPAKPSPTQGMVVDEWAKKLS